MQNLQDQLVDLLQNDEKLVIDGQLNKNKIVELALKVDPELIKRLILNETFKNHFFVNVEGVLVFDKIAFQRFVNNKTFLPDSYTIFKNKVGLTINDGTTDNYLNSRNDVVLVWPHKDCVLEGGQTKEEEKRNEIFWNETLAPDEVDRLLDPKVFTNWKKFDKDGEHPVKEIQGDENLLIRGNNLLALSSLKTKYRGQVKLIYIDPPYNTGTDTFQYNDNFNQSTWLTFMRNRLEEAYELLDKKGSIFIHIDHHQLGYLIVLMDEIFGVKNKVQIISVRTASPAGFKTVNPGPIDVTEYILFYTKDKPSFKFKKAYVPVKYNKNYNLYLEKGETVADWKFIPIKEKTIKAAGLLNEKEGKQKYGSLWDSIINVMIEDFAFNNAEKVVSIRDPHKPTDRLKELMAQSKEQENVIEYKREDDSTMYLYKGGALAFYSNKKQLLDGKMSITELLTDFWGHISWAGIANEGGVKLKNGKKPEKLIKQILELATNEGDLVLDYHLGSGTTAATAHKMKRRYIGIEQLDYGQNDSLVRLNNVINGDQTGISKFVDWSGGGSFIYCELKKNNQYFIEKIQNVSSKDELLAIWTMMYNQATLSYQFNKASFNEQLESFKSAPIEYMKSYLIEVLDKNQLYVNYSEINDSIYEVGLDDKKLNSDFYAK